MIKVVACEPKFAPLLMIRGINNAKTTAFSISCSKKSHGSGGDISLKNRMVSQPARLFDHFAESD